MTEPRLDPKSRFIAVVGWLREVRVRLHAYEATSSSADHQSSPQTKYGWT